MLAGVARQRGWLSRPAGGGKLSLEALADMHDSLPPKPDSLPPKPHVLDEFISQLLGAGAVLSQIISQMVRHAAATGPLPDVAPIPDVAHELLAGALTDLKRYSRRDLTIAARILEEATDRICEEVYFVPLDELDA